MRIVQRTAWVVKFWSVPNGVLVIPSPSMAFILLNGMFSVLWIAYAVIMLQFSMHGTHSRVIFYWRTLPFIVLYSGNWWTAFGLFGVVSTTHNVLVASPSKLLR